MKQMDLELVQENLTNKIQQYIHIIKNEFSNYMSSFDYDRLNNIIDFRNILKIYDYGEISAYANHNNVFMPLCADKLLRIASKIPGYGINKKHKTYDEKTMVINDNTFLNYVLHVFFSGTNAEGYYDDLLLHEVMHFCGSGGGSVIEEGTNELLTRMLAKKYNLRTNSCGYPKEVKLAYELMNVFGEETMIKLAFTNQLEKKLEYLIETNGEEAANLYLAVSKTAEHEFQKKYYLHMSEFSGPIGIAKKIVFYNKIDYSSVLQMIENYKINHKYPNEQQKRL